MLSKNQIKEIQYLHLKKHRDKEQLFIAEGIKICLEFITSHPELIKQIFCTHHFYQNHQLLLNSFLNQVKQIDENELQKISLQENPNEVLVVASYFKKEVSTLNFKSNFSFYLDDIRDPGNMGTILRLADWYGMNHIFASESTCDIYNPKVIQSSMGAILRVNVQYQNLALTIANHQIERVYGALLNGQSLYSNQLQGGLIVIGNEANGINKENLAYVTHPITIPSAPTNKTESLNAAVAASIIVSEFYRQLKV